MKERMEKNRKVSRRIMALLAVAVLLCGMGIACASAETQHTSLTVAWELDQDRTYEPGTMIVKRRDGVTEETTILALVETNAANAMRFKAFYEGAEAIVIAKVGKVAGPTNRNGYKMPYGYVETEKPNVGQTTTDFAHCVIEAPSADAVIYLNPGDVIVATGRIWSAFGNEINLYGANQFATTVETYDQYMAWQQSGFDTVGAIVTFGSFEQDNDRSNGEEPIEWQVLAVENGKSLLISRYVLTMMAFDTNKPSKKTTQTWESSTLRKWLNGDFLKTAFSEEEQKHIQTTELANKEIASKYQVSEGKKNKADKATKDKVFLLSQDEVNKYFGSWESRIAVPTQYAIAQGASVPPSGKPSDGTLNQGEDWYLRNPLLAVKKGEQGYAYFVYGTNGNIGFTTMNSKQGVRVALWYEE